MTKPNRDYIAVVMTACALIVFLFLGVILFKSTFATGKVDYCYTEYKSGLYPDVPRIIVSGHREWRQSITITRTDTLEEALQVVQMMHCQSNIEGVK